MGDAAEACGSVEDGCRLYGGWFYLVGAMVTKGEQDSKATDSHQLAFWFTQSCPDAPAFRGGPLLAIEFTTQVKWVLPESPE
jgi:hypothetical protein